MERPDSILNITPATAEAKRAVQAFGAVDEKIAGKLTNHMLENLINEVGEAFHFDDLGKQLQLLDSTENGYIIRSSFVDKYSKLGEESDGGDSLDADAREEREEKRVKAAEAFDSVATSSGVAKKEDFCKLFESLGTTYCGEAHRRTLTIITNSKGMIDEESFVSWYLDYMFNDDDVEADWRVSAWVCISKSFDHQVYRCFSSTIEATTRAAKMPILLWRH